MRFQKIFSYLLIVVFLLSFLPTGLAEKTTYKVVRVIDGDTIELENGEKVRYIGIDTPETVHPTKPIEYYGKEAAWVNRVLVEGEEVHLEFDVQQRDKYGRLLAYVYLGDILVNAWLVENGFAKVSTIPPNVKYSEKFLKLQKKAREEGKGLWAEKTESVKKEPPTISTDESVVVYITRTGKKYHRGDCRYLKRSKIPVSLTEAVSRGYAPCKVCKPPNLDIKSVETISKEKKQTVTDCASHPDCVWVSGHSRQGTYVKGYYRKDGTYVRGHYRGGSYVKGHWRSTPGGNCPCSKR